LDALFRESAVYTFAHAPSSLCAPARFAVLTSRYPSRSRGPTTDGLCTDSRGTPLRDIKVWTSKLVSGDNTIARVLFGAGYHTGAVGKWHLSVDQEGTYDDQRQHALDAGFTFADGFSVSNHAVHNTEWTVSRAAAFIAGAVDAEKPFYLYFNPTLPHIPLLLTSLEELEASKFDTAASPTGDLGPFIPDPYALDGPLPLAFPPRADILAQALLQPGELTVSLAVTFVDEAWAALQRGLGALGVLGNTVVAFHMDHGFAGKASIDEGGVHIALMIRGAKEGFSASVRPGLVTTLDLGPTFAQLAGVAFDGAEGRSLLAFDGFPADFSTRTIFVEFEADRGVLAVSPALPRAVRYVQDLGATRTRSCTGYTEHLSFQSDDSTADLVDIADVAAFVPGKDALRGILECHNLNDGPCADVSESFTLEGGTMGPTVAPTVGPTVAPTTCPGDCATCINESGKCVRQALSELCVSAGGIAC